MTDRAHDRELTLAEIETRLAEAITGELALALAAWGDRLTGLDEISRSYDRMLAKLEAIRHVKLHR